MNVVEGPSMYDSLRSNELDWYESVRDSTSSLEAKLYGGHEDHVLEGPGVHRMDDPVKTCANTERYFQETFRAFRHGARSIEAPHCKYVGGVAVVCRGEPVGLMKQYKVRSMLATKTVVDDGSYSLVRGAVCKVDETTERMARKEGWGSIDVNELYVDPSRLFDTSQLLSSLPYNDRDSFLGEADRLVNRLAG